MTFVVTEACIRCKYMDCVNICPVDCFHEGSNMLVIHPDECIDCGVCEPECPASAIVPDTDPEGAKWLALNLEMGRAWPVIQKKGQPPADADAWKGVPEKYSRHFSREAGRPARNQEDNR